MLSVRCLFGGRSGAFLRMSAVSFTFAFVACTENGHKSTANFAVPVSADAAADSSAPDAGTADGGNVQVSADTGALGPSDASTNADANAVKLVDASPDATSTMTDSGSVGSEAGADGSVADGAWADAASDAGTSDGGPSLPAAQPRTVHVGSLERTFLLYIPKSIDKAKPAALISVHHGFTMTGKIVEEITTWKSIAERERIVVAFPDGGDFLGPWNVGENVCNIGQVVSGSSDQDDLGFVKAIIESANADQPINKASVFVAGFSMGGYFANNAGCQGRAFLRAVSAHSGGTYAGTCPGNPLPVLLIHGDADGLIDYECATQARGYWIERNGCTSQVMSEPIKGGTCEWNQGCPAGRELGLCTMKGMDHGWAGAPTSGAGAWLTAPLEGNLGYGGGVEYEDAAELMWKFFKKYL